MTVGGDRKAPTRPDLPFTTSSTGVTLKPGGRPVKVRGQSESSSSSRAEAKVGATWTRSHKEGVLRKSQQLYQRYLEHNKEEGEEAPGELRLSLHLYKRYLEHLGEEGNETLGRKNFLLLDLSSVLPLQPHLKGPHGRMGLRMCYFASLASNTNTIWRRGLGVSFWRISWWSRQS